MSSAAAEQIGFYDAFCADGGGAASALKLAHPDIKLVPLSYGNAAQRRALFQDHITPNSEVYFVDIAPTPDEMTAIVDPYNSDNGIGVCAASVHVWDHHYTSAQNLSGFAHSSFLEHPMPDVDICIDERCPSASMLTWQKLFPDQPVPELFKFIGKMEPHGRLKGQDYATAAYIDSFPIGTPEQVVETFNELGQISLSDMTTQGVALHRSNVMKIEQVFNDVRYAPLQISPHDFAMLPMVNVNVRECGRSIDDRLREAGESWLWPRVAIAWFEKGDQVIGSVRTTGGRNAAQVAGYLGAQFDGSGGGHPTAAAFCVSKKSFLRVPLETQREVTGRLAAASRLAAA